MQLSFSVKKRCPRADGTRAFSRLTEVNPLRPRNSGAHVPCLLNSPDSINRLFYSRQPGCVPHVGTGEKRLWGGRPRSEGNRPTTFFRLSRLHTPLPRCLSFNSLMKLSCSDKKRCPRADGTRAFSRLTEVNPLRPRNSGAHVPCLLNSPDSINRLFYSRQPGCVPHVGTGEKRLWGGRPRSEGNRPTTFFRLSRLHTPLPRCLSFNSLMKLSCSDKKRCPRAFPMSGPTAVNRPRHGKGTRAFSRLTDINPLRPRNSGAHVPCLPKKSFFLMFPLCKWGAIGKPITDTPWLFAVFVAPVVLAPRYTDTPWLHDQPQDNIAAICDEY